MRCADIQLRTGHCFVASAFRNQLAEGRIFHLLTTGGASAMPLTVAGLACEPLRRDRSDLRLAAGRRGRRPRRARAPPERLRDDRAVRVTLVAVRPHC
jgi:hypothetical protein